MGAKIFGFGVGSVRGVVYYSQIERKSVQVNNGIFGDLLGVDGFSNCRKVRAVFHFNDGEVVFGVDFQESFVLKIGSKDRDRLLVFENRTKIAFVFEFVIEIIVYKVGVLGMFVKNTFGDLNVAGFRI